jgi:hypothetical protein
MEAVETLPLIKKPETAQVVQESKSRSKPRLKELAAYIGGGIVGAGILAGSVVAVIHGVHTQDLVDQLKACPGVGSMKSGVCQGLSQTAINESIQSNSTTAAGEVFCGSIASCVDLVVAMTAVASVRGQTIDSISELDGFANYSE